MILHFDGTTWKQRSTANVTRDLYAITGSGPQDVTITGIAGTMAIKIVGKQHFYDLEYSLPPE